MYDPVLFYTDEEYSQLNPRSAGLNIQAEVEQPAIHFIALCSSTVQDQAALVGDRLSCILELSEPVITDSGIEVRDTLRFFTGDHPAVQFEQGTKQGGTYKCGACATQMALFDDQAHALQREWRSLRQLQTLATGGRFGRQAGVLKPFELKVKELRSELEARGVVLDSKVRRADLENSLDLILRGVSRVPALLLANPTCELASLNLGKYEMVACEPLHDIKGHVKQLITELPFILPQGETKTKCDDLILHSLPKDKITGADIRKVLIQLYLLLKDLDCSSKIILLLQSILKITEIAYSRADKRCPRQLLQMYNMCWLHMELCKDLLSKPVKLSKTCMFGIYLHALTAHSPTQLELACLRSLNTEHQERLFSQIRRIAQKCTNHHPDNIIPQVLLRLQAKQEQREFLKSVVKVETQVSCVAKDLPQFPATKISTSFIQQREDSWQVHLQRISPFLVAGVDVWWSHTDDGFLFHDGDTDRANPGETFSMLHHRYHSIKDVELRRDACWKRIVDERIVIPAQSIKLYDSDGHKTGRLLYSGSTVTLESSNSSTTETEACQTLCAPESLIGDSSTVAHFSTPQLTSEGMEVEQSAEAGDPPALQLASEDMQVEQSAEVDGDPLASELASEDMQVEQSPEADGDPLASNVETTSVTNEDSDVFVDDDSETFNANTRSLHRSMAEVCHLSKGRESIMYPVKNIQKD